MNSASFVEIKKVILTPLFDWKVPNDWGSKLINQNLIFKIMYHNNNGGKAELPAYSVTALINPNYFQPVFTLNNPIDIPGTFGKEH